MKTLSTFIEKDGVKYYPVIGLEIHAEMKTNTKMWCSCKNEPDEEEPNKNICPVCMAHPGTLPVPNKQAIQNVIKMGLACGSTIANFTEFDRKNYFYPDIPKGYQISQYKYPIVSGGSLGGVDLTRIHLEEDTATSQHDKDDSTLINFNRAGVPLMELVTEPVIHDSATAVAFAKEVQLLMQYLNISEASIEKGHMRLEANVSLTKDPNAPNKKYVEVKNIGSFKSLEKAIEFEFKRQIEMYEKSEEFVKETRGFDEASGTTKRQRNKEDSSDYRYFPDPDISKLKLHEDSFFNPENLKNTLPELPNARRQRYLDLGIKIDTAEMFVTQPVWGDYFDNIVRLIPNPSPSEKGESAPLREKETKLVNLISNYVSSDLAGLLKEVPETDLKNKFPKPEFIKELCEMIAEEKLASRGAKDILGILVLNQDSSDSNDSADLPSPLKIAQEKNLLQISDEATLSPIIDQIISDPKNEKSISDYKSGKENALMALVGQVIKSTSGRANPTVTKNIFIAKLK